MSQPIYSEKMHAFLKESNRIEGVDVVERIETSEAMAFLSGATPKVYSICRYVNATSGAPLREKSGMDVRVGSHVAPPGGKEIRPALVGLLSRAMTKGSTPYSIHHYYETLHPFMDGNGRSGRLLWLWMHLRAETYMGLGFLHQWYYESLDAVSRGRRG